MSVKLTAGDRKQIIIDWLQGIPNKLYEVKESASGTYRVIRRTVATTSPASLRVLPIGTTETKIEVKIADEPDEAESPVETPKPTAPQTKSKRNVITNEDIMHKLNELHELQNKVPQRPPPEPSTPKPPVNMTPEEQTKKVFEVPKPSPQVPLRPVTGRRKLVLR